MKAVGYLLTFIFLFFAFSQFVTADSIGLTIRPVKISDTLEPGNSTSGAISIDNESDEDVRVSVVIEDFVPSVTSTTDKFVSRVSGITTAKDWITLNTPKEFILEEGATEALNYTIDVPNNAEPGEHIGVIFFETTKLENKDTLKINTRLGLLVTINVSGERVQQGKVLNFSSTKFMRKGSIYFQTEFENTGTVRFKPEGTITIKNIFSRTVAEIPMESSITLPRVPTVLNTEWDPSGFLFGRYKAELVIKNESDEDASLPTKSVIFYAFSI